MHLTSQVLTIVIVLEVLSKARFVLAVGFIPFLVQVDGEGEERLDELYVSSAQNFLDGTEGVKLCRHDLWSSTGKGIIIYVEQEQGKQSAYFLSRDPVVIDSALT